MAIVLVRIDDRLIHGQVSIGWGPTLRPDHIVLLDESVAGNDWELELYRAAAPDGATVDAVTVPEAAAAWRLWHADARRILVLVRSPRTLRALGQAGIALPELNVGGMHFSAGKREVLPYVFVDDADCDALRALHRAGAIIEARDLPGNAGHDLVRCLG